MRSVQKEVKDILMDISNKTGYPYDMIEDIYIHQFEFISDQMRKGVKNIPGTYENILIKKLGSFIASEKHILKLKEITDAKEKESAKDSV